ncbi:unnamed protein product [Meganyctiphanes norvegica]|uniref:MAE-28990/MAE-18760-like HEPN domain-containing protein n=1 Tax=Meganyctiphanes norvegica TaxID=48144 RepID=A0AAV2R045_MEGNR
MMDCADNGSKFEEHLPTIRAHYAYLECGRHLLKEIFLWILKKKDITNVQEFILNDLEWGKKAYSQQFDHATREMFKCNEIGKIDISALVGIYYAAKPLFKSHAKEVDSILNKIRKGRNSIVHKLFLKVTVHSEEELKTYLADIHKLVEDTLTAFEGVPTEQQKSSVQDFVNRKLNEARKCTNKENAMEQCSVQVFNKDQMNPEDNYLKIVQDTLSIVGLTCGNLTIYHPGQSNFTLNMKDCKIENQNYNKIENVNVGSLG